MVLRVSLLTSYAKAGAGGKQEELTDLDSINGVHDSVFLFPQS